ncbi:MULTISPECIES: phosphatidate cytidylyltransferase [unclassified Curtobacterium]|uniref:phosphatidate cytidylyltransferase n=1 Tax=unclassified Curtobacterium TaxID=257496 RepID=UPI000DA81808|nr:MULTISPECIES: phosphatidate cytidylyltransferase [unclassified Curtobacterium]WIB62435.1 phosphatidate cytidylyltransferase [Curtobacterium sp. MCBD17_040]WIE53423.1 phosphatidate cytidylyltransferase [Curtobacterium sp. MCBD17_003]
MEQSQGDPRPESGEHDRATRPASTARRLRADLDARARSARTDFETQLRQRRAEIEARNEQLTARTGRNLPAAIGIGVVFGLVMVGSLVIWKALFILVGAFLVGVAVYELATAMRAGGRDVPRIPSVLAGVAIAPIAFFGGPRAALLELIAGIVLITVWRLVELAATRPRLAASSVVLDLMAGLFVQVYVALLAGCAVLLTALPHGQWWTMAFLIVVVSVDTGAYASGLSFGKHPMAPRISPKKTWEGFGGSLLASMIAGVIVSVLLLDEPWWFGVVLGVAITASATIGDLTESMIKRDLGIKDISTFLPGHGGLLDRIDSVLPSAAVAYVLYLVVH